MVKEIFELFGLKQEPKHPIVARMELYRDYNKKIDEAFGVWVIPMSADGSNDKTALRLYLPMGQLRELLNGKFADGFVQQYPSIEDTEKERNAAKNKQVRR